MKRYTYDGTRDELVDLITNLIDNATQNGWFSTYDEWQKAVEELLKENELEESP